MTGALRVTRVLVVDGVVEAATSLSHLLQMHECLTAVGFGGDMGIRVGQLFHPDLVLLDLESPGQDGCDILAKARRAEAWGAGAMVIGLAAEISPNDERRYRAAGFDCVVRKPIDPTTLAEILMACRHRKMWCEAHRLSPHLDEDLPGPARVSWAHPPCLHRPPRPR
ncbi:MAG TPA: response regulator [Ideonella sp.]|uniref:response regulator n=1 Tax=Ideonella sp. TaxID=1929293 RepID=UPI002E341330|nr:response regulator [Ideonella sp.]HEX5683321.1 response regulator [Ideonella sp.]